MCKIPSNASILRRMCYRGQHQSRLKVHAILEIVDDSRNINNQMSGRNSYRAITEEGVRHI